MAPDRGLERLARCEPAAREGPRAGERLARPLPEERGELAVAHLQHHCEHGLRWVRRCVRLGQGLRLRVENLTERHADAPHSTGIPARSTGSRRQQCSQAAAARTTRRRRRRRRRPAEALKVGLIVDRGQLDDNGFNELAFKGLKRAEQDLGVEGRVVESASAADYIPNMSSLARDGYDLIIGVGFAQGDAIGKAAKRFPKTKFAIIDVSQADVPGKPKNVQGLLFREEEVGYLAGYLAGLQEKGRDGPDSISAVGGFKEPPVDRFIAGYRAGAREGVAGDHGSLGLLAGLGRPGQVQGAGAQPDRSRLGCRLPGRRRLRPRRAERGRRAGPLGNRRRRRPVVPRQVHPHERAEGCRRCGLPDDQVDPGPHVEGRPQRDLRAQGRGSRSRQGQPARPRRGHRQDQRDQARDHRAARSRTSRGQSARAEPERPFGT